jgi:hypothetical protein
MTFLSIPLENRYRVFDFLTPSCTAITIGTVLVDPKEHSAAVDLASHGLDSLSVAQFIDTEAVLANAADTISPENHGLQDIPRNHRVAMRSSFEPSLLEIKRRADCRGCKWGINHCMSDYCPTHKLPPPRVGKDPEPLHLACLALTCSQLYDETNRYLGMKRSIWIKDPVRTTLHLAYPLGLLAAQATLPGLLLSAPRIVLAGFYDPSVAVEGRTVDEDNEEKLDDGDGWTNWRWPGILPALSRDIYERAALVVDMLVERLVEPVAEKDTDPDQHVKVDQDMGERSTYENDEETGDVDMNITQPGNHGEISTIDGVTTEELETRAANRKVFVEEEDYPLTLQIYVPRFRNSRILGVAAPSPYASAICGPRVAIMVTCHESSDYTCGMLDGELFDGFFNCRRTYIVGVGRGPRRAGAGSAISRRWLTCPMSQRALTRIMIFGKRAAIFARARNEDDAEFVAHKALVIREAAMRAWRDVAHDAGVRPRISLRTALSEAAEVLLHLAIDQRWAGNARVENGYGEWDDAETVAHRTMEYIAWGMEKALMGHDDWNLLESEGVKAVKRRMAVLVNAARKAATETTDYGIVNV